MIWVTDLNGHRPLIPRRRQDCLHAVRIMLYSRLDLSLSAVASIGAVLAAGGTHAALYPAKFLPVVDPTEDRQPARTGRSAQRWRTS